MSSRAQIAAGKGSGINIKRPPTTIVRPSTTTKATKVETSTYNLPTIVLPNAKRLCSIILFFVGSFAIGFGAGFGTGFASKECV